MSKVYVIQSALGKSFGFLSAVDILGVYTSKKKAISVLKDYLNFGKMFKLENYANYIIRKSDSDNSPYRFESCFRIIELNVNEPIRIFSFLREKEVPLRKYLKY